MLYLMVGTDLAITNSHLGSRAEKVEKVGCTHPNAPWIRLWQFLRKSVILKFKGLWVLPFQIVHFRNLPM